MSEQVRGARRQRGAEAAKSVAHAAVQRAAGLLVDVSHRIHGSPELCYEEHRAAAWLGEALERGGYEVTSGLCDLPTAFAATRGAGPVHVAFLAEYDALPGIGHACGHNIIAASALGAALALREVLDEIGLRVSVFGTPAEEGGGGKIRLLRGGVFDGVRAAMMVHPAAYDVLQPRLIAAQPIVVRYVGRASHASAYPEEGINAGDALTVAQVAIGLLRQHLVPTERVHGIVTRGGEAPQIIPSETAASYLIRSADLDGLEVLRPRVLHCFEAGAQATGARLELELQSAYAEVRHHPGLTAAYARNATSLGRVFNAPSWLSERGTGSTDAGNVSRVLPVLHPWIGIDSLPAVNHQADFTAACIRPQADRALLEGATALAWTAIDAVVDASLRDSLTTSPSP
jgi:amidohydrolase